MQRGSSLGHGEQASGASLRLAVAVLVFFTALNVLLPLYIPAPPSIPIVSDVLRREKLGRSQQTSLREWDISLKQVALTVEDSVNFQLDTPGGAAQWNAIRPPGDGYVTLGEGSDRRRYRLAMFHALDCLDTVRQNVVQRKSDGDIPVSPEAHYCLDYIRQTIQCRSDIQLEQVRSEYGGKSVQPFVTHNNCRDWSKVYAEIERLYAHEELGTDQ